MKGIEPSYAAWEAAVLPLNYTRDFPNFGAGKIKRQQRLCEALQSIYSQFEFNLNSEVDEAILRSTGCRTLKFCSSAIRSAVSQPP